MDRYDELKRTIDKKYTDREVECHDNIINLYELYHILTDEIAPYRTVMDGSEIQRKINADRTIIEKLGMFKKRSVVRNKCTSAICSVKSNSSRICFGFEDKKVSMGSKFTAIVKDFDSDEIYFDKYTDVDKAFVEKYISEIYEMFAVLEEYGQLFPYDEKEGRNVLKQSFDDGVLNITISLDLYGRVKYDIRLSEKVGSMDLYNRDWLNRESIRDYVERSIKRIFMSIPININDLNDTYKLLVEHNLGRKDNLKLVKKGE